MIAARTSEVNSVPQIGVPFAPVPLDLMRRRDISPLAKLAFAAIANNARMRRGDRSRMTNAQVAAAVGMTASGIRRPLDELEAAGLIERAYEAGGRVRAAIRVFYAPAPVDAAAPTPPAGDVVERQPGCRPGANPVGAPTSAILKNVEEQEKNVSRLSNEGEKTGTDPKPSPAEVAAAIRAMAAGKYAPAIWPTNPPTRPESAPAARGDLPRAGKERPAAPPRDAHDLARGIFVDARRSAYAKPGGRPKTAAQQIAELAAWRRRQDAAPCPAPETNEGRTPRAGSAADRYNQTGPPA